jgi:hypothetical protein
MTKQKRQPADGAARRKANRPLRTGDHPDRLTKVQVELPDGRYLIAYERERRDA